MPPHVFSAEECKRGAATQRVKWATLRQSNPGSGKSKTGRPQSEFFNGKAHQWTKEDALKSLEVRRRKAAEKRARAETIERETQTLLQHPGFADQPNAEATARRLVELQLIYEDQERQRLEKQTSSSGSTPTSTPPAPRRQRLPNESPLQALKLINFPLYRDLLAKAGFD